jgi:hypothetical protein
LEYSQAKKLPLSFLATLGLRGVSLGRGERAVAIPYFGTSGDEIAVRYRLSMTGDQRFRWRTGSKVALYGLQRLAKAREGGWIIVCEGESDTQTAWFHNLPCIGLPGAGTFREDWAAHFEGFDRIFVADEGDDGAVAIKRWIAKSSIRDRVHIFTLDGVK